MAAVKRKISQEEGSLYGQRIIFPRELPWILRRHIFTGATDVVVCDGFVGNVLLKVTEGVADTIMGLMKEALLRTLRRRIGAMLCRYALLDLAARVDRSEFGGAPLLGVNGICMIGHGGSDGRAMCNAIRRAAEAVTYNVNKHIVAGLKASAAS